MKLCFLMKNNSISYLEWKVLIISIFIYSDVYITILAGNADSYKKELKRSLEMLRCIRFPAE